MSETGAGTHTLAEILSQTRVWRQCFAGLEKQEAFAHAPDRFPPDAAWLFIGCGSSFYIAQAAAASWKLATGRRARAVPASEVLLYPDLVLEDGAPCLPVLISRSGHTSEVVKAAEFLELKHNTRTLAITCASHHELEEISTTTLYLPSADEQSMVMTRSFTSMLLGLQMLAARVSGDEAFAGALQRLPAAAEALLAPMHERMRKFVASHDFSDYVYLAQGPLFGIASEAMLKVKEMSCSYAQAFHTLEFRHGPKAIVSPETLVCFLLSETGYEAEREVLEEVKGLGGTTLVVANAADADARSAADFLVELALDVPELARLAPYLFAGQLLGLATGVKKGFDPDRPRNLSRVVILEGKN